MKQKYPNDEVIAPGTVIISAGGHCNDIKKVVEPVAKPTKNNRLYYINLSEDSYKLGGSSFAQIQQKIGDETPTITDAKAFKTAFNAIQQLIKEGPMQKPLKQRLMLFSNLSKREKLRLDTIFLREE